MMRFPLLACVLLAGGGAAAASGWPQWRGPDRTGVSAETGLLKTWPKEGPPLAWKATGLGGGYSTPSVAGGRVFLMGSQGDDEYVTALGERDGRRLWSTRVGRVGENRGPKYPGPRSTPTVDGELLYTLGSDGDLVCAETATGKVRWRHHLVKEFKGNPGIWAYAESVLIDGDRLVCTPGGPVATMLALDKHSGAVVWKMAMESANGADYASITVAEVGGVRQYVQFLGTGVIGVAADDGRLLWRYRGNLGGAHAAAPIFHDGCVFTSASGTEGAGGDALLRLTAHSRDVSCKEVYLVRHLLNHHGGVIRVGDC